MHFQINFVNAPNIHTWCTQKLSFKTFSKVDLNQPIEKNQVYG